MISLLLLWVYWGHCRLLHRWRYDTSNPLRDTAGALTGRLDGGAHLAPWLTLNGATAQFSAAPLGPWENTHNVSLVTWLSVPCGQKTGRSVRLMGMDSGNHRPSRLSSALLMTPRGLTWMGVLDSAEGERIGTFSPFDMSLTPCGPRVWSLALVLWENRGMRVLEMFVDGERYKSPFVVRGGDRLDWTDEAGLVIGGSARVHEWGEVDERETLRVDVLESRVYSHRLTRADVAVVFAAEQCSNGRIDPGEEGVDCGGLCMTCEGRCANGLADGDERDVDCGGSTCDMCERTHRAQPQLAVYAPRWPSVEQVSWNDIGRRSVLSILKANARVTEARIRAVSGAAGHRDDQGSCGPLQSASTLLGVRGFDAAHRGHTSSAGDACEHSWSDVQGAWVIIDLGSTVELDRLVLWNWNVAGDQDRGVRLMDIDVAERHQHVHGAMPDFVPWRTNIDIARAPGAPGIEFAQVISMKGVRARYLRLHKMVNWLNRAGGGLAKVHAYAASRANAPVGWVSTHDGLVLRNWDDGDLRLLNQGDVIAFTFSKPVQLLSIVLESAVEGPVADLLCDTANATLRHKETLLDAHNVQLCTIAFSAPCALTSMNLIKGSDLN